MKKIVILSNTVAAVLNFRAHLITYLVKNSYKVYCFATDYDKASIQKVVQLGAEAVSYKLSRGGLNPIHDWRAVNELTNLLREIKPYIVLSSFAKPVIYGTVAANRAGVPRKAAMLEGLGYYFTNRPEKTKLKDVIIKKIQILLYKFALPKADLVIFLNNDDPNDLLRNHNIKVKKMLILGGIGLQLSQYKPTIAPISPLSFLFIGRLLKDKGIVEFLKAAEIVKDSYPNVIFKVIGSIDNENPGKINESDFFPYVERKIIEYPGHVSNVNEWISNSSVFVLPSYREGFPRSTQEAMAIGRAVITTDVPGCRETVENDVNGFIIPKWSSEGLAKAIIHLIHNPNQIIEMGIKSRKIAEERYDGEHINNVLLKAMEDEEH